MPNTLFLPDDFEIESRHPSTQHFEECFSWDHLQDTDLSRLSQQYAKLAGITIRTAPDGPELSHALRCLLSAKDAAVRAMAIEQRRRAVIRDQEVQNL